MTRRATIAKRERELREYHDSFRWRSFAVKRYVDEMIAAWRKNPPRPPRPGPRLNNGETYAQHRGDIEIGALRDGMEDPGL
jgi:hypothetical protein